MSRLSVMQLVYESGRHNPFPSEEPNGKRSLSTDKLYPTETKVRQRPSLKEVNNQHPAAHQ